MKFHCCKVMTYLPEALVQTLCYNYHCILSTGMIFCCEQWIKAHNCQLRMVPNICTLLKAAIYNEYWDETNSGSYFSDAIRIRLVQSQDRIQFLPFTISIISKWYICMFLYFNIVNPQWMPTKLWHLLSVKLMLPFT